MKLSCRLDGDGSVASPSHRQEGFQAAVEVSVAEKAQVFAGQQSSRFASDVQIRPIEHGVLPLDFGDEILAVRYSDEPFVRWQRLLQHGEASLPLL